MIVQQFLKISKMGRKKGAIQLTFIFLLLAFGLTSDSTNLERDPETKTSSSGERSKDWRDENAVTEVKNQGQCNASWAFAVVAYFQSFEIISGRQNQSFNLSEQYLLECTPNSSCKGGSVGEAIKASVNGLPTQDQYTYSPSTSYSEICDQTNKTYVDQSLTFRQNLTDNELMYYVDRAPVIVQLCSQQMIVPFSGAYTCSKDCTVDQAALLVGYDHSFWIIKNSFGKDDGQDGYKKIIQSERQFNCKITSQVFTLWNAQVGFGLLLCLSMLGMLLI